MALTKVQKFIDDVLAHVPEDKKEAVRSAYSQAQDEASSLDQAMARVKETADAQSSWYTANKAALDEYKVIKAGGTPDPLKPAAPAGIGPAEVDRRVNAVRDEVMTTGLGLMTTVSNITINHYKEFGEPIDAVKLANDAIAAKKPLTEYYAETVAERRQVRDTAARAAEITAAEARGAERATADLLKRTPGGGMPYPVGATAPTTLAGLRPTAEGQASPFGLEAAVATATAEMARQAGS